MLKITNRSTGNKRIRLTALDSAMSNIDDSVGAVAKVGREVLLCLAPENGNEEDDGGIIPLPFQTSYILPEIHYIPELSEQGAYLNVSFNDGEIHALNVPAGTIPALPNMSTNFMAMVMAFFSNESIKSQFMGHMTFLGTAGDPPTESTPENPVGIIGAPFEHGSSLETPIKLTFHNLPGNGVNVYEHLGFTGDTHSVYSWGPVELPVIDNGP